MIASYNGHTAAVKLLLAAGADKDAKDEVREIERD
jgi:ankyrin repeat protein